MLDTLMAGLALPAFSLWNNPVSWLELLGFVLAFWMVMCNIRVHPLGWPLAILSSALYGVLFWQSRLYGEAALQVLFIGLALWGWVQWVKAPTPARSAVCSHEPAHATSEAGRVNRLQMRQAARAAAWAGAAWLVLGGLLASQSDSDVPYLDALSTTGSVLGQWLLARKFAENWLVWLAVNLLSVLLFAYKGLWLTTLLYALLALMSVSGWLAWQKRLPPAAAASV